MTILGLHHISIIASEAQRTVDFYTKALGLRLVKKTVNFDDPSSYHLYFGDETGKPGSAVTFFVWPTHPQTGIAALRGKSGVGGTHHFALAVSDYNGLLMWKRRLTDLGIPIDGPFDRHYFTSI
jgi:glyoxalase family protein